MSLLRISAIALRQFYLMRGSIARFLPLFIWVALDMTVWGFLSRYLDSVNASTGQNRVHFVPALLGAVLLWDFFIRVMQGVTTAFFEEVWSRNFLNIFASPLSIPEFLAGLVLSTITTSAVGLVVMLILSTTVFGLSFGALGLLLVPFLLVLFLFGIALGIFGSSLVLWLGPAAEWFVWPIPALIAPFAAVYYPLSVLPAWMQVVARTVAPAYVFEGMRAVLAGHTFPLLGLVGAIGIALIDVVIACAIFYRIYRHAVRTGLIARYSAETV